MLAKHVQQPTSHIYPWARVSLSCLTLNLQYLGMPVVLSGNHSDTAAEMKTTNTLQWFIPQVSTFWGAEAGKSHDMRCVVIRRKLKPRRQLWSWYSSWGHLRGETCSRHCSIGNISLKIFRFGFWLFMGFGGHTWQYFRDHSWWYVQSWGWNLSKSHAR